MSSGPLLLTVIMVNPVAQCLALQDQPCRLQCIGNAIQAGIHHGFAIDYINLKELLTLFKKLEKRDETC
jgi:hypothetical protein